MGLSLSELSITLSKAEEHEEISFYDAFKSDAESNNDLALPSISDERIEKGIELLETYLVTGDPISGGMGSVWRVHHEKWNTDLAMKRPHPAFFAEGSEKKKKVFIEECETWIWLGLYPNIVSCYYVREIGGVPSIFSEWMDGGSLKDRIRDGSLYEGTAEEVQERILDIAIQAARGLHYAHVNDIVHQDVKPGNILLTKEWDAKIADFGLAGTKADMGRELEDRDLQGEQEDAAHRPQRPRGYTPEYCPREQAEGAEPETWMDTYALALTILEMYIGKRPWNSGADAFTWFQKQFHEYRRDEGLRAEIPQRVVDILSEPGEFRRSWNSTDRMEKKLISIYREVTGNNYPRPEPTAIENNAGTLNNMALSFLDLGKERTGYNLLTAAADYDGRHPDVVYNKALLRWRRGNAQTKTL